MSEIYLEIKLRMPSKKAPQIVSVFERANPTLSMTNLETEFSIFGESAVAMLREAIAMRPFWVDESLTLAEQLQPQDFRYDGELAKIQFIGSDDAALEGMESFVVQIFEYGGIEIAETIIYSEDDLDDYENSDDEDEFSHLEF